MIGQFLTAYYIYRRLGLKGYAQCLISSIFDLLAWVSEYDSSDRSILKKRDRFRVSRGTKR